MRHCPLQKLARIVLHGLIGLLAAAVVHAENSEADIKAAFIYNFAKFVEWPEGTFTDSKDRLLLCTQGDTVLARKLRLLAGREAQGRTIEVRPLTGAEATTGCHILLTPSAGEVPAQGRNPTLTISESTSTIWSKVALPDHWSDSRPTQSGTVWYRFTVSIETPSSLLGIYIKRACNNA